MVQFPATSPTWDEHYARIQGLLAENPRRRQSEEPARRRMELPVAPVVPWIADGDALGLGGWDAGNNLGAAYDGGAFSGSGRFDGFPNVATLSASLGVDPLAARAGLSLAGLVNPAVGLGLGLANAVGNVANTATNYGMLSDLGVSPGFGSVMGGLLGFNGLAGNPTAALNAAMGNQYSGFANLSTPQYGGDFGDFGGWGGWGEIAAGMDAANQGTAGTAYEGQGPGQAAQGEVTAEPLGGFKKGGYTGAGRDGRVQPDRVAGVVHEGEVVIPHHVVRRLGLLAR